jgi:putative oxidoreductase
MDTTYLNPPVMLGGGLLIARLVLGSLMVAHGGQKLFGWLGGYGLRGTGGFFEQLGFRPGVLFAGAAAVTEVASGLLVALGFLGPVGPALMISVMVVAAVSVHLHNGLLAGTNGVEVPVLYATGALALALVGTGPYSVDSALGLARFWTPGIIAAVLILGVAGALANLALRRPRPAEAPETSRA